MVTKDTTLNELFDAACSAANSIVQTGEVFIVQDLFRGVEWNRISIGLRVKLGSMFFAYVNGEAENMFDAIDKTAKDQQRYIKR